MASEEPLPAASRQQAGALQSHQAFPASQASLAGTRDLWRPPSLAVQRATGGTQASHGSL